MRSSTRCARSCSVLWLGLGLGSGLANPNPNPNPNQGNHEAKVQATMATKRHRSAGEPRPPPQPGQPPRQTLQIHPEIARAGSARALMGRSGLLMEPSPEHQPALVFVQRGSSAADLHAQLGGRAELNAKRAASMMVIRSTVRQ